MFKDELRCLGEWVIMYASGAHNKNLGTADFESEQETFITAECQRIKKVWMGLLFSKANDEGIKRYIRIQQQVLLGLADKVYQQIRCGKQDISTGCYQVLALLEFLLGQLLELNDFQLEYFNSYINQEAKMPDAAIPSVKKKMAEAAEKLSASMQYVALDVQLKACICDYLARISAADIAAVLNYLAVRYFFQFTEKLAMTTDFEDSHDLTHSVMEVLFYINFNHTAFCQWYREDVTGKTEMLRSGERLPMLMKEMLALKAMPVMATGGYDPQTLPVNMQLEHWLNELVRQENYVVGLAAGDQPAKIGLKLTVAQLALLVRLLYEEGIFAMKNIAGILRFFSGHFMTKKQAHISYGSMNKLYYSGDQFTGYAVRALLLKLVAKINKMFFPV